MLSSSPANRRLTRRYRRIATARSLCSRVVERARSFAEYAHFISEIGFAHVGFWPPRSRLQTTTLPLVDFDVHHFSRVHNIILQRLSLFQPACPLIKGVWVLFPHSNRGNALNMLTLYAGVSKTFTPHTGESTYCMHMHYHLFKGERQRSGPRHRESTANCPMPLCKRCQYVQHTPCRRISSPPLSTRHAARSRFPLPSNRRHCRHRA